MRERYKRLQRLCVYRIFDTIDEYRSTGAPTQSQYDETAGYTWQEQQTGLRNRALPFHPTANRAIHARNLSQQDFGEDRTFSAIQEESASVSPSHASSETDSESFEDRFERLSQAIKESLGISFSTPAEDGAVTISKRKGSAVKGQEPRPDLHGPKLVSTWSPSSSENDTTATLNGSIETSAPRLAQNRQQRFVTPSPKEIPSWRRNPNSEWSTTSDGTSNTSGEQVKRALLPEAGLKPRRRQFKEISPFSPIPLNYDREIGVRTPSIHSKGSKPDLESPSYASSRRAIAQEVHPAFLESAERGQLHRPLRIWRDEGRPEGNIRLPRQRDGVLTNVTNTRHIGAKDGQERVAGTGGRKREERRGAGPDTAMRPEGRKESRSIWRQVLPGKWRNRLSGLR